MAEHNELGKKGEDVAADFLQQNGHLILNRNYRFGKAEIDIISKEGKVTVFTEVKTRSTEYFGFPEEFVDRKKREQMKTAAEEYLYQNKLDTDVRFDVISVLVRNAEMKIEHIKDAFFHEE